MELIILSGASKVSAIIIFLSNACKIAKVLFIRSGSSLPSPS